MFFYDSYAIIEYLQDNPVYTSYFEKQGIFTLLNVLEVYYSVLNEEGKAAANEVLDVLYPLKIEPTKEEIRIAMVFRSEHKRLKVSYVDCLGYCIAKERGIKFLTGDNAFKGLENVEFVK